MKSLRSSNPYFNSNLSFIDMLFLLLLHVFALFILAIMLINPTPQKKVDEKAQYIITVTWDDHSADDIDTWILLPNQEKIWYRSQQSTYAALERDDLGITNDFMVINGDIQPIYINQEIARVRQALPGQYVVNVQLYDKKQNPNLNMQVDPAPVDVTVMIERINPTYVLVAKRTVTISTVKEEKTGFSFSLDEKGNLSNLESNEIPFINDALADESRAMSGYHTP